MLTESEILYAKKLLKEKNHHLWQEKSMLYDLHRHCKFTIRKLTHQMANIDNFLIFKRLKEPTREHTLYLVYRAERLYSALTDASKIFKLLSVTLFQNQEEVLQKIVETGSLKKEDQVLVKKREIYFRRIMAQVNNFMETYKLFSDFNFRNKPFREFLMAEIEKLTDVKLAIEENKKKNPQMAAEEEKKLITADDPRLPFHSPLQASTKKFDFMKNATPRSPLK
mmetsp:Transcript_1923/g.2740  ORF Transcript_1923/g.2740 Transcript_1923/m.2740 type:complete len:224 (-) Transcript_1923:560-1231(-)